MFMGKMKNNLVMEMIAIGIGHAARNQSLTAKHNVSSFVLTASLLTLTSLCVNHYPQPIQHQDL